MQRLAAHIWRTIRRLDLMPPGARVVAALSGGADSIALVHLLCALQSAGKCKLAGIAHLNHGLRPEADADEAFCREVADSLGVSFVSDRIDVRTLAARQRTSIEAAGHRARYAFYESACEKLNANCVALGHTRDDQAETLLLRLLRGAGPRGLAGMRPRNGLLVRPMIDCSREEVRAYVTEQGLAFREDATNSDVSIPRNRVRHEVLPALARAKAGAVRALGRAAVIAGEDNELLERLADQLFAGAATQKGGGLELDLPVLQSAPRALVRRVVATALQRCSGGRPIGFDQVEAAANLALRRSAVTCRRSLPGQVVVRTGPTLAFLPCEGKKKTIPTAGGGTSYRFLLSIPGEVTSPEGWSLSAERLEINPGAVELSRDRTSAVVDASAVKSPLIVRNWQAGDRFRPFGLGGTRKLQDFFTDRKVPREVRHTVPLVVAGERIVWVAGYEIAEDFRVTAVTCDVVILKLKHWRYGK